MIKKRKKQSCDSQAVSELIGTVLLLAIAVALFSVVYVMVSTVLVGEAVPQVNIVGYVEGDNIILENLGGESLGSGTILQYIIAGNKTTVPLNATTLVDDNDNNRWDIGERIVYDGGTLTGYEVDAAVIYSPSNTAIFYNNLQAGSSNGTIVIDVDTSVNTIEPYTITTSPHTIVATGDTRLTSVTLWYRYSSDNTTWNSSSTWWNRNWTYARPITIDSTLIDEPLRDFPILIRINETVAAKCDRGRSIRFIDADNETEYKYEIERWLSSGTREVWVKIPYISATEDTSFYLYYNNSDATDNQSPEEVWDSNFVMVQHLNESSGTLYDSTSYHNNADEHVSPDFGLNATGIIDGAVDFDGNNDYLTVDDAASLDIIDEITMSLWVKAESYSNAPDLITKGDYNEAYSCWIRSNGNIRFSINDNYLTSSSSISTGSWYYLSCTRSSDDSRRIFINGVQQGQDSYSSTIDTNNEDLYITTQSYDYDGFIDEVRLSNTARNASWVKASYYNQKQTDELITIGSEENHHTGVNWTVFSIDTTYPWQWNFTFPYYEGYYQFYSIGRYNAQTEDTPETADAMCRFLSDTDQIGLWHFNENTGTITYDAVGDNNGNINGASWTTGKLGSALYYDGSQQEYVNIPYAADLSLDHDYSIAFWIYPVGQTVQWRTFLTRSNQFTCSYIGGNKIRVHINGYSNIDSSSTAPRNTWTHVVFTFKNTDVGNDEIIMYINGQYDNQVGPTWGTPNTPSNPIRVGGDGSSSYYTGKIDELIIYDTVLSSTEVESLYNQYS